MRTSRTLLVGLGNPIAGDDGIGIRIVTDLAPRLRRSPGLDIRPDCSLAGFDLVELFLGYDRVVLVDAVEAGSCPPGTVSHLDGVPADANVGTGHVHGLACRAALEVLRRAGQAVPDPRDIHVIAIATRRPQAFTDGLSDELAAAYPSTREAVAREVRALLRAPRSVVTRRRRISCPTP